LQFLPLWPDNEGEYFPGWFAHTTDNFLHLIRWLTTLSYLMFIPLLHPVLPFKKKPQAHVDPFHKLKDKST